MVPRIAVIVSTYNHPKALEAVLASLADQTAHRCEVVVADDGSDARTRDLCERIRPGMPFPLMHVWQEDCGFRLAAIRNRAVAATTADYCVLLDGDCVVLPDFVTSHARLAEPGYVVRGPRVQLDQAFTESVLRDGARIHRWSRPRWLIQRARGHVNQFLPFLKLPLGPLRKRTSHRWPGIRGSNLGVWRRDFLAVNGFDEDFEGWGYEDWDFVSRLLKRGVKLKEGRFAVPVLHLWHDSHEGLETNRARFERQRDSDRVWAERGVIQYLERPRSGE